MYRTLSKLFVFAAGAAVGSAVTWKYLKNRNDQIIASYEQEIDEIRDLYANRKVANDDIPEEAEDESESSKPASRKPDLAEYAKRLQGLGYANTEENIEEEEERDMDRPYVITPEEFGENEEYDTATINYYSDKVLAYDWGALVEDVDDVIGADSLNHFGQYEPDSVYVRNDTLKCDYEILMSERAYADVIKLRQPSAEEE